jgi:gamma-glutamylcyclotransferase (GGCT)/AIG2-like uncharacterized protein YtfP
MDGPVRMAFYGSLRPGGGAWEQLRLAARVHVLGRCELDGTLLDLGDYPGLVPGPGRVVADVVAVSDPVTLALLDDYEGFESDRSAFVRVLRQVDPWGPLWVYEYRGPTTGYPAIPSGDWLARK